MKHEFTSLKLRAANPRYYILTADSVRSLFKQKPEVKELGVGFSCLENEYKVIAKKVSVAIATAHYNGDSSLTYNMCEEVAEEMAEHLMFIGYTVLLGVCKNGNRALNIRW